MVVLLLLGCVVGVASAADIKIGTPITESVTSADPFTITYGGITSITNETLITATLTSSKTVLVNSIIPTFTSDVGSKAYVEIKSPNGVTVTANSSTKSIPGQTLRAGAVYEVTVKLVNKATASTSVKLDLYGTPDGETTFTVTPKSASATAFMVNVNGTEYTYSTTAPTPSEEKPVSPSNANPETGQVEISSTVSAIGNATAPKAQAVVTQAESKYSGETIVLKDMTGTVQVTVATPAANKEIVDGIVADDNQKQSGMTAQSVVEITTTGLTSLPTNEYYAFVISGTNVGQVTHQKSDGTWANEKFVDNGDGTITVFLNSFSPIVVYAAVAAPVVDNGGADDGLALLAAALATPTANVTATPTVEVTVVPTATVTGDATAVPTDVPSTPTATGSQGTGTPTPTQAPAPILGLLAGLGVAALILRRN